MLETLMDRLNIGKVYWVDDENASPADMDVTKLISTLSDRLERNDQNHRTKALRKLKAEGQDARGLAERIEQALASNSDIDKVERIETLLSERLDQVVGDSIATLNNMLAELLGPLDPHERAGLVSVFENKGQWEWHPISFTAWNDQKQIVFDGLDPDTKTLLIVDLQNTCETIPLSGRDVLAEWAQNITSTGQPCSYAVVLTSEFTEKQEILEGRKFTNQLFERPETSTMPILVISKKRFSENTQDEGTEDTQGEDAEDTQDENAEERIAKAVENALGRLRACNLHQQLSNDLSSVFETSVQSAFQKLQQLSIEEMLYAVSASSFKEGISEVDTLVRMASIAQRQALLDMLTGNSSITDVLIELRGLHDKFVYIDAKALDSTDGIEMLRRSELHEPLEVVNHLLSPITSGDIFEIEDIDANKKYYVLVANACDLMLRGKEGSRKLDQGLLLTLDTSGTIPKKEQKWFHEITHFPATSPLVGKTVMVDLKRTFTIPLEILDLSWTHNGGHCTWSRSQELAEEFTILPSQKKRYDVINNQFETIASPDDLHKLALWVKYSSTFDPEINQLTQVDFSVTRVGRLASSVSSDLNSRFAQVISRPSREHNFST